MTMPVKNAHLNMRINKDKKKALELLFENLGLPLPQAINIFFECSLQKGGLPFEVTTQYNARTESAMREARELMNEKKAPTYTSAKEFLQKLELDEE